LVEAEVEEVGDDLQEEDALDEEVSDEGVVDV
jgi:hypothetical protein